MIVSSMVALALCETTVRIARLAPAVQGIWLTDEESFYYPSSNPILGHELKPSFRRSFPSGAASSNRDGLRDPDRTTEKPPGGRRILILGDSVVEGIGHVADDATISQSLERLYDDGKTEVFNLGTSGYCTFGEIELLEQKGLQYSPDVVVLIFVNNDFQNFNSALTLASRVDRPEVIKRLFLSSHLFRLGSLHFDWYGFGEETSPLRVNEAAIGENNVIEGMARLNKLAVQHRFKVLVAIWPTFADDEIIDSPILPGASEAVGLRLARMSGLPTLMLSEDFKAHHQRSGEGGNPRLDYTAHGDGMHPNALGSEVAADALKRTIEGELPSPRVAYGPIDREAVAAARVLGGNMNEPDLTGPARVFRTLLNQCRDDEGVAYLKQLLVEDPNHYFANYGLSRYWLGKNASDRAIPFLKRAVEIQPGNSTNTFSLATALISLGRAAEAITVFDMILEKTPPTPELHYALAFSAAIAQEWATAEKHLAATLKLDPNFQDARHQLEDIRRNKLQRPPERTSPDAQ
ncbi:MAG: lysophospholipase L1-like esterase [Limisphaerales bacterium]|jgi:lysophospholipase L1-like esterase